MFRGDNKDPDSIQLSGEIEKANSDSLVLKDANDDIVKVIHTNNDGTFSDTLINTKGFFHVYDGKERFYIYLNKGYDLHLTLNTSEFDESLTFKGTGQAENNYLARKTLNEEKLNQQYSHRELYSLEEKEFLKSLQFVYENKLELLNQQGDLSEDFISLEKKSIQFERARLLQSYKTYRGYITHNPDFHVFENFPDPFAEIELNNEKNLLTLNYIGLIESRLSSLQRKKFEENKDQDYILLNLALINETIKNPRIKEELAYRLGKWNMGYTEKLENSYQKLNQMIIQDTYKEVVKGNYEKLSTIMKSNESPKFELKDINGRIIALDSLKGILVYIDVWSTWCGPCRSELPHLKTVEEKFRNKDIHFVSISQNGKKENWKKVVKKMDLKGIQLFAPDSDISFLSDYLVTGVPRFILLDKEGKIIDSRAPRPSNPELMELFNTYL